MKKNSRALLLAAFAVILAPGPGKAMQVFQGAGSTLDLGARLQLLGELSMVTDDPIRYHTRVYLFNKEERLFASGTYGGTRFHLDEALGAEAMNGSDSQNNLLELNADIPLGGALGSLMVGQFKVPTNLESADDSGYLLFTEKSELTQMFFNEGYDTGLVLHGRLGGADALLGAISGAPNIPNHFLPELMNFPPMLIARFGFSHGLGDDPFRPRQEGFEDAGKLQYAAHVNVGYASDSDVGHTTLLSLQSDYFDAAVSNSYYGNVLLYKNWNPYLGRTAGPTVTYNGAPTTIGPVNAHYWRASVDGVLRDPVAAGTWVIQGQINAAGFAAADFQSFSLNSTAESSGSLAAYGAELITAFVTPAWACAGRFSLAIPDAGFAYNYDGAAGYTPVTGSEPIYELTLPSIVWRPSLGLKVVAEAQWLIDTPEALDNDGVYLLTEMPTQVSVASDTNPVTRATLVPVGRMMVQYAF